MKKTIAYLKRNLSSTALQRIKEVYKRLPQGIKKFLQKIFFRGKNDWPAVSCICTTYGRVSSLEESIHAFLAQEYQGVKELIILNDYAQQTLVFDHPDVCIVNLPKRFRTIGEKYKAAVGLCTHDLIFVWHDDEIYLPDRLTYAVRRHFAEKPYLMPKKHNSFFSIDKAWIWNGEELSGPVNGRYPGSSSWSRGLFAAVRGYAHINEHFDQELETRFTKHLPDYEIDGVSPRDIYYIRQDGENGTYQMSEFTNNPNRDAYDMVADFVRQQAEQGEIPLGRIELIPQWRTDYNKLVTDRLQSEVADG